VIFPGRNRLKIRTGFVSNSSSSAFVVALDEIPHSQAELRKMLFDDKQTIYEGFPVDQVVKTVFNDLMNQTPMEKDEVIKEFQSGYIPGRPAFPHYDSKLPQKEQNKLWRDHEKECDKYGEKVAKEFNAKNKKRFFFRFHYSDNDGAYGSALEHGGLFDNVPNYSISHH
jgi:hypothetical protein